MSYRLIFHDISIDGYKSGPLPVIIWSYEPYKYPYKWVTGVIYNPYKWSYNPTYNWFLGPPCNSEMHPNLGWTHETF